MTGRILRHVFLVSLSVLWLSCHNEAPKPSDTSGKATPSVNTNQTDEERHYNQGVVYSKQGKLKEAVAAWEKVVEINPAHEKAHFNLGVAYKNRGQLEEAIRAWKRVIEVNPNHARTYNNLGSAYIHQGQLEEAIAVLKKAVDIDENYGKPHYNLARVYAQKNQVDASLESLHKAMSKDPLVLEEAKKERDFESIRDQPGFQKLIESFEGKPTSN